VTWPVSTGSAPIRCLAESYESYQGRKRIHFEAIGAFLFELPCFKLPLTWPSYQPMWAEEQAWKGGGCSLFRRSSSASTMDSESGMEQDGTMEAMSGFGSPG
jgi:hypothetical protein